MSKIGNLVIGVGLNLKGLSKDLNRASYKLNAQGAKWKKAGMAMSSAFTLPFAAVGVAGVKMALDIESSALSKSSLYGFGNPDPMPGNTFFDEGSPMMVALHALVCDFGWNGSDRLFKGWPHRPFGHVAQLDKAAAS